MHAALPANLLHAANVDLSRGGIGSAEVDQFLNQSLLEIFLISFQARLARRTETAPLSKTTICPGRSWI